MKKLISICILSVLAVTVFATQIFNKTDQVNFLTVTDIHFDPFLPCNEDKPCKLIQSLQKEIPQNWDKVFESYLIEQNYGEDTNHRLLQKSLEHIKYTSQLKNVKFAFLLGDFLAHNYKQKFQGYTNDLTQKSYQQFVYKTMKYITLKFKQALPGINVYPIVGNNDSYIEDYTSNPKGALYHDLTTLWSTHLLKSANVKNGMKRTMPLGGSYAFNLPEVPKLKIIMLNTVLFTSHSNENNKELVAKTAKDTFNWLHQLLDIAKTNHERVMIVMHIPPGIDIFKVLKQDNGQLYSFWKKAYTTRFLKEVASYAPQITAILASHTHMDWFQILTYPNDVQIPLSTTAALSPVFNNNPSYKLYALSAKHRILKNAIAYYLPLDSDQKAWTQEYDFNEAFQPNCKHCDIINGMKAIKQDGNETELFKSFYNAKHNVDHFIFEKWLPYYWCRITHIREKAYQACIDKD